MPNLIEWMKEMALPFWIEQGVDRQVGGFFEAFGVDGAILRLPRRAMVQARQIYVFRTAIEKKWLTDPRGREAVERGADFLIRHYSLPSGAFVHSVDDAGRVLNEEPDLYAQAFAAFGLASAFVIQSKTIYKDRALALLRYLLRERRLPEGGFSEIRGSRVLLEANPHMHLFEAALQWIEIDSAPEWRQLADEILELCLTRFIDPSTGALCENFESGWVPVLDSGRFMFEPGHHYEWAWLMGRYQTLVGGDLMAPRERLCRLGDQTLLEQGRICDEVWSDLTPKKRSSRFWPYCERIKAKVQAGEDVDAQASTRDLMAYFATPVTGLWFDRREESGEFKAEPTRASGLYHITGAASEISLGM